MRARTLAVPLIAGTTGTHDRPSHGHGEPRYERSFYNNRAGSLPPVVPVSQTAARIRIEPVELVSTRGPCLVTATVCSK